MAREIAEGLQGRGSRGRKPWGKTHPPGVGSPQLDQAGPDAYDDPARLWTGKQAQEPPKGYNGNGEQIANKSNEKSNHGSNGLI